ncbi:MAG: succinate dehydrogenase, hydrophobic membrane anchor protein [Gammaproteobacteria bacterium]
MGSLIGRVQGLGTARHGFSDWWVQRLSAVALVPLGLWFVTSLLRHVHAESAEMTHWAARPWNTVLLLALLILLFQHLHLGLKVVIEDYVRGDAARLIVAMVVKAALLLLWLAATLSVLRIAFVG